MDILINSLQTITEYRLLLAALQNNESAAITGIGQINRSHMIAGIAKHTNAPIVVICQDDMAAKRTQ